MKSAASRLAKLLRPYKIEPRTIKLDNGSTAKGYHRADFEEAWRRHLSAPGPASEETDKVTIQNATSHENVIGDTREGDEVTR
jgi:hypothetical protein